MAACWRLRQRKAWHKFGIGPPASQPGSAALGLHLEGPFLSPLKRGAHNPAYLRRPAVDLIRDWSPADGVRLVTLAPELPGALEVVRALRDQGVVGAAGHSTATVDQARAGFTAGIRYDTHLFNIAAGCRADLVLLTREMQVAATFIAARQVFGAGLPQSAAP